MANKTDKSLYILGISAFYHDSAAVLLKDGKIIAAAHEERFSRTKHDLGFPVRAIEFCLSHEVITLDDVTEIVFYEKPFVKFERLIETYYLVAPLGLVFFLESISVWIKEKLFMKKIIKDELRKLNSDKKITIPINFSDHHLSHAASAFYPSPFEQAAILTIDGVGEWSTATIAKGQGNQIKMLKELQFPHSLGLLYSAFTYFLGFRINSGEYKLMGLAPYGNVGSDQVKRFKDVIKSRIVSIKDDGSIFLNLNYFRYIKSLHTIENKKWEELFGIKVKKPEEEIKQVHCDLALAIQEVTEEVILKMAKYAKEITGDRNICLAGGVALNCVANSRILQKRIFKSIWIQPAAGDAGGALGAALAYYYMGRKNKRSVSKDDSMSGSYLGPEFSSKEIETALKKYKVNYDFVGDNNELAKKTAQYIADEKTIGWFQGRMEWGPRALGNRSILGDPRSKNTQKQLNLHIKYRESFRPFAPSVLAEHVSDYFDFRGDSPYMLLIAEVKKSLRKTLPANYIKLDLRSKLYFVRSELPAITHIDFTARLQTVHKQTNPLYWSLINEFKKITGYGVIVNTSFNVRGEPIVCTPEDAIRCFFNTEMDYLVIGNFIVDKKIQNSYDKKAIGTISTVLD